jgi:predicted membrane metal-binding protein
MRWIWNSAALSISCQLATGPLAYLYFGTFPQHFLLTNLISLPLTGFIIPCALASLVLSGLGWCPTFVVSVTEWLVSLLTWSLEVIASM